MFFAHQMLRPPSAGSEPARPGLWLPRLRALFSLGLGLHPAPLATGYGMVIRLRRLRHISACTSMSCRALGIVMMLAFADLYFAPWPTFRAAVDGGDRRGGAQLRKSAASSPLNLVLGSLSWWSARPALWARSRLSACWNSLFGRLPRKIAVEPVLLPNRRLARRLCPSACTSVTGDANAAISILAGCKPRIPRDQVDPSGHRAVPELRPRTWATRSRRRPTPDPAVRGRKGRAARQA